MKNSSTSPYFTIVLSLHCTRLHAPSQWNCWKSWLRVVETQHKYAIHNIHNNHNFLVSILETGPDLSCSTQNMQGQTNSFLSFSFFQISPKFCWSTLIKNCLVLICRKNTFQSWMWEEWSPRPSQRFCPWTGRSNQIQNMKMLNQSLIPATTPENNLKSKKKPFTL